VRGQFFDATTFLSFHLEAHIYGVLKVRSRMVLTPINLKTCSIFGCRVLHKKEEVFSIDWFHLAQHLTGPNCKGHFGHIWIWHEKRLFFLWFVSCCFLLSAPCLQSWPSELSRRQWFRTFEPREGKWERSWNSTPPSLSLSHFLVLSVLKHEHLYWADLWPLRWQGHMDQSKRS